MSRLQPVCCRASCSGPLAVSPPALVHAPRPTHAQPAWPIRASCRSLGNKPSWLAGSGGPEGGGSSGGRDQESSGKADARSSELNGPPKTEADANQSTSESQVVEEEDVDDMLRSLWADTKKDLQRNLGAEEAGMLEDLSYEDIMDGQTLIRKVTQEQLGPVLESMGIQADAYEFFIDMVKVATLMQLLTAGALFYGTELWGHFDAGEAWRAVSGLTLGYVLRPFFKVEQLLWPVYNFGLRLVAPQESYQVPSSSREEMQATINRLGIMIAAVFFLPQALLHWDVGECLQLVVPMGAAFFLFDIVYMLALMLKVGML